MKQKEIELAEQRGQKPMEHIVGTAYPVASASYNIL